MSRTYWLSGVVLMLWGAMAAAQSPDRIELIGEPVAEIVAPGPYWLGVGCAAAPPALRAQLNLPEKQGVLVQSVAPDSPAAKAGIMQHDVLLRAGDKALTEPRDLVDVIKATKEGTLKIDLIRGGKSKTVEATPAKRPEAAGRRAGETAMPGDWETMEKWMREMSPGGESDGQPPMRFRFFRPGAIVPRDVLPPAPLPANMSIAISKEGDQPAKIVVKRGDEKWEVTEKELDKLPADVRPHVERILGRGLLGIVGGVPPYMNLGPRVPSPGNEPEALVPDSAAQLPGPEMFDRMEKRFDEMNRRMDKLMKEVEALGAGPAHHKAPEKPAEQPPQK